MHERNSVSDLAGILRGELSRYSVGEKLPSSRALVDRFRVSPVTVSRALGTLAAEGLVVTRPGAGAFRAAPHSAPARPGDTSWQQVALSVETPGEAVPRAVDASGVLSTLAEPPPGVIELSGGYLHPTLQPERALAAALGRAGRRPGAWGRPPIDGVGELRAWFAREIGGPAGTVAPSDVLVTAGGQSALTAALRALAPPGAPVLVESPAYPGILAAARASGQRLVPVPVDAGGVRTDLLAEAFRASGARVLVCQPLYQNPTGAVLAGERRREVVRIAREAGAFVVEDDFARFLSHEDAPAPAPTLAAEDPDGIVVHVCSLTKITSPSLRVGALAARGPVLERLRAIQVVDSFFVPRPLQEAALELVGSPAWSRHRRTVAAELRTRREVLLAALERELPDLRVDFAPPGGFYVWARLPDGTDEAALAAAALRAGVVVSPGRPYFAAEAPAPFLRIGFATTAGTAELEDGVRGLRTAWEEWTGTAAARKP
ncbi:aminotransferase-like domain-containing protein [Streptomyces albireticuli]|uniref:GntR family transcriptional regulator n=1 Tax=Streptomyces albireticuli TaxID=1940 RepID=A0A2A2D8D9_9ACTN|nr:PLP-dependent aminotransferase family protein [Streptomyces albireticuli]MCD9143358.1 PLP-dependent aminotransferase family protein [Streptomyces albireticuli]MCD9163800.1 PLP-dependent aminotransferase family protein [Streptomyces albireticuli]MCD9191475.1 PLP-dependent aminotransferase family protein [Streptomyces albireticuli]PAU47620.1 GntR family transcriptional regulator [Streptomyces albireticuli]